jgi:tetratricopeptide (TPR) repeat protein
VIAALVLVLAQASGGWAAPRPAECASLDGGRASNLWERAKAPELRRYCDLLARGAARLATAPQQDAAGAAAAAVSRQVLDIADEADHAMPGKAGPDVLRGRALAKVGRWDDALKALREAKSRDERALDDPQSLLAWGRALARTGNAKDAQEAYRALLPRASVLAAAERGAASIEAGLLAMEAGPQGLDEAIAILRQARRDAQDAAQTLAVVALALALDRAGEADEARAALAERVHTDPRPTLQDARVKEILATAGAQADARAAAALALETIDARAAREEWHAFVAASGSSPWIDHARRHEAAPSKSRAPTRPR